MVKSRVHRKTNVYLPSELIDNCPLYGGFSDDLYENTMPAARVRQCPFYKELFNREMHRGDVSMAVISRCPLNQV